MRVRPAVPRPTAAAAPPGGVVLWFVRHGESTWNAERRIQGQRADVPLSDLGRRQALRAARLLRGCGATVVFSSDQRRAVETADRIAALLGVEARPNAALRERSLGVLEGRRSDAVLADAGLGDLQDPDWRPPGGESMRQLSVRVGGFLDALLGAPPGRVVVLVSHGDAIRAGLAHLAGRPAGDVPWRPVGNAAPIDVLCSPASDERAPGSPAVVIEHVDDA